MTRISLDAEQMSAVSGSWLQERYHSGEGETVADFLSFESVHEINPFEVGGSHSRERREYRRRRKVVDGKTTLLALVTGDCPFSYACDVTVFGVRRGAPGVTLARLRTKIGSVSSAQHAYEGRDMESQMAAALRPSTRLLLLDEPCCGMSSREAAHFARKVASWLNAHPRVAAVWVEHQPSRIPQSFTLVKELR